MKKYLQDYIKETDKKIKEGKANKQEHLTKIQFFQHERLVHLIVTFFYALFDLMTFALININILYILVSIILTIFLLFYVKHYFDLENGVQYLYKQYDKMIK